MARKRASAFGPRRAPCRLPRCPPLTARASNSCFIGASGISPAPCRSRAQRTQLCWNAGARSATALSSCLPMSVQHLWLASFRADGACAFRALPPVALQAKSATGKQPALFTTPARFDPGEYSAANLDRLRWEMRAALQEEGLFPDEADALLNTWEVSYFKSAGLRLFFMVPRAWTDWLPAAGHFRALRSEAGNGWAAGAGHARTARAVAEAGPGAGAHHIVGPLRHDRQPSGRARRHASRLPRSRDAFGTRFSWTNTGPGLLHPSKPLYA